MSNAPLISLAISILTAFLSIVGEVPILLRTDIKENNHTRLIKPEEIWAEVKTFGPRLCLIALGANISLGQFYFRKDPASAEPFFWLFIISVILWVITLLVKLLLRRWTWPINIVGLGACPSNVFRQN